MRGVSKSQRKRDYSFSQSRREQGCGRRLVLYICIRRNNGCALLFLRQYVYGPCVERSRREADKEVVFFSYLNVATLNTNIDNFRK